MIRRALPIAVLAAALSLALSACGGGDEATTTAATEPPPATTAPPPPPVPPPPPPTETTPTETTPKPKPKPTMTVVFRDGKVVGGIQRVTVEQGQKVTIVLRSDVADEAHLHGYDKSVALAPSKVARLALVASLPGGFELELEERGLQVAELTVTP